MIRTALTATAAAIGLVLTATPAQAGYKPTFPLASIEVAWDVVEPYPPEVEYVMSAEVLWGPSIRTSTPIKARVKCVFTYRPGVSYLAMVYLRPVTPTRYAGEQIRSSMTVDPFVGAKSARCELQARARNGQPDPTGPWVPQAKGTYDMTTRELTWDRGASVPKMAVCRDGIAP